MRYIKCGILKLFYNLGNLLTHLTKHPCYLVKKLDRIRVKKGSGPCLKENDLYLQNWLS